MLRILEPDSRREYKHTRIKDIVIPRRQAAITQDFLHTMMCKEAVIGGGTRDCVVCENGLLLRL
jgi:hypothetical protein